MDEEQRMLHYGYLFRRGKVLQWRGQDGVGEISSVDILG